MNKIDERVSLIRKEARIGLMTHLVFGYPSLTKTVSIAKAMEDAGADFIELQIPFSDPIADGPTIMHACEKSLKNGFRTRDAVRVVRQLSSQLNIPILLMGYYNTVFRYGVEKFCRDFKQAGASGLIVPDMPLDEERSEHYIASCNRNGLYNIRVLSPSSTRERILKNARVSGGFIYCTAVQGVTGTRRHIAVDLPNHLTRIKRYSKMPLAVGFGISSRSHVKTASKYADIVVVGSAIIKAMDADTTGTVEDRVSNLINGIMGR